MLVKPRYCDPVVKCEPPRSIRHTVPTLKTTLRDGLLDTVLVNEERKEFGDEHQNYRDYSLQNLIQCNAVDLLKPVGTVPVNKTQALDAADSAFVSMSNFQSALNDLKSRAESQSSVEETKSVESSESVENA